ncbi:MAG: hydrogenase 4 subunit F [Acidobacteria bacterium]|nr:hydrogenase 4 subunit F [Acidobacteriota bacterium]
MILPALFLVPFAAGVLSYLARRRQQMEAINLGAFALTFVLAVGLAAQVVRDGAVEALGGFLYADAVSALVAGLTALVGLVTAVYAVGYLRDDERNGVLGGAPQGPSPHAKLRNCYALTPLLVASILLVALANNLGVMWVAIEATTLASVFLVGFYGRATSLEAAWKYAIIGGVGLSMALFGTVVTYYSARALPGADTLAGLNWSVLAARAGELDKAGMRLAFILILLGYGTKAGIAPMHTWKPDAYSEAPVPAAAILSSAMLNCALYGLIRYYALAHRSLGDGFVPQLLILFGLLSMGLSVPFVLVQRNFRRLLAYHTIDHAGIMVTALGIGGALGTLGLMLHMTYHTIAKSLLFLCAGNVYQHYRTDVFHDIKEGVIRSMPLTGAIFLMATLAIVGMPPFSLFQSEFLIVNAAFAGGHYLAGVLFVLFGAGVFAGAILHVGKLVLGPVGPEVPAPRRPWRDSALLAMGALLVAIAFWLPGPLLALIRSAAQVVAGE